MNHIPSFTRRAVLGTLAAAPILGLAQETYPSRPIRLVVPFPVGGSLDALGRQLAMRISPKLGQPVVLESKPGANSQLGATYVARAAPDGYTLLLGTDAAFSIAPAITPQLPYHPQQDFIPLTMLAQLSLLMVAHPSLPASTLPEFLAYARANPGKVTYASLGVGSLAHIAFETMSQRAGIEMLHVPYQGIAPAVNALLAGEVQLLFAGIILPLPHIRAGKLKPIAYAGVARHPLLPDVPTFAENGLPGFESRGWFGAFAPRGTPSPIAQTLAARLWEAASSRDLGENFLVPHGFEVPTVSPGHFPEFLLKDQQKWSRAVSLLGAKLKQ